MSVNSIKVLAVSMESGLVGRNNLQSNPLWHPTHEVSMESGLVGRNNTLNSRALASTSLGLNGVRPSWPEQFTWLGDTMSELIPSQWSPA